MSDQKKINYASLFTYCLAAIIPILILFGFRVFYVMGYGQIVPNAFLLPQIFFNGLASLSFFYYLKHSSGMEMTGTGFPLLFSLGYGFCSYALFQEIDMGHLFLYALLPLLFLMLERFMEKGKTLGLILLLSLCFCVDAGTGIVLTVYLLGAFFAEQEKVRGAMISDLLHLLLICLFSFLLSAMRSFPRIMDLMETAKDYTYAKFNLTAPGANFFSRFLLGGATWQAFPDLYGLHLYFGLFFMLCFILYFGNTVFSKKKRRGAFLFTLFLLGTLELFPLQYLLALGAPSAPTLFYVFFPVFWFLKTAASGFTEMLSLSRKRLYAGMALWVLLILFALSGSYLNFHTIAFQSNIIFMILFALVVLGLFSKYFDKTAILLLPCLICLELFCNMFLSSNQNFLPATLTQEDRFFFQNTTSAERTEGTANAASPISSDYESFRAEHDASSIYNTLNTLFGYVELTHEEELAAKDLGLLNIFERANTLCYKIGATEDLFTPVEFSVTSAKTDYRITDQGNHIYNLYQHPMDDEPAQRDIALNLTVDEDCTLYLYNDFSNEIFLMDVKAGEVYPVYFLFTYSHALVYNFQISAYKLNEPLFNSLPDQIADYALSHQTENSSMKIYYLGLGLTCICVFLLLLFFFNADSKKYYRPLLNLKKKIAESPFPEKLVLHFRNNYVYWLAALIPMILFVTSMVVYSCMPFGNQSFFDQDGLFLTLPSILDWYYNLKEGSLLYSLNGGYGYSLYANNPIGLLFYYPLTLFEPGQIPGILLLGEALCLGLCSFTMVYYLTHRLSAAKADKRDYRLLVPGFVYTLNAYMLAMHGFSTWYTAFLALPLLFLAFEYLMYKKRRIAYIFLLAFMIYTNLYLALYICIFLALSFFASRFESFKDFVIKGVRFGICSILAACSSFFIISNTLLSSYDSSYNGYDSVLPTPGFHMSFLDQWNRLMILTETSAIDQNPGGISLYMGILTMLLILLYFTSEKISVKEKIRKLILLLILFVSFNGQVLSYVWNGFHYQANVPNRYVFLLMFLCGTMAYDGLRELKRISLKKGLIFSGVLMAFFAICQFGGEGNEAVAFYTTMGLVLIYAILLCVKSKLSGPLFVKIMTCMLGLELTVNMFYFTTTYGLDSIYAIQGYEQDEAFIQEKLLEDEEFFRIAIPASYLINDGLIYHHPGTSLFNSFVTQHQTRLATFHGFLGSTNFTIINYNGTPLSHALAGNKYILLPRYSSAPLTDLYNYEYLGHNGIFYVYRNPNILSLGFYAPLELTNISEKAFLPSALNDFTALYTGEDTGALYTIQVAQKTEDPDNLPNSFRYADDSLEPLSDDEAIAVYMKEPNSTSTLQDLYMDMNLEPADEGFVYLYLEEFLPVGRTNDASAMRSAAQFPSSYAALDTELYYVVYHEDVFEEFMENASKQQLENVVINGSHISGTTDYDKDGYTIFSLPYERGFKAYLDGKEVEVLDPLQSFMAVKTPKGKHTIELVYEPYGMKISLIISGIGIILSLLFCFALWKRQQHPSQEKQQPK